MFVSNNTKTPTTGIWTTSQTTKAEINTPEVETKTSHANELRRKGWQNSTHTVGTTPTTTETMPSTTTKTKKIEVTTSTSNTETETGNSETRKSTQSTWYTTMSTAGKIRPETEAGKSETEKITHSTLYTTKSTTGKIRPEPETGYPETGESAQAYTTMTTTKTNTMKPETETTIMWTKEMETSETDSLVTVAAISTKGRRKPEDKTETSNDVREEFLKKPCIDPKGTLVYIKIRKLQICNPTSQGTWIEPCSTACNKALEEYNNSLQRMKIQDSTDEMAEHSKWQSKERKYKKRVSNNDDAKNYEEIGEKYRQRYDPTYSWGKKDNMWSSRSSWSGGDTRLSWKSNKGVDLRKDYEQLGETHRKRYEPTAPWRQESEKDSARNSGKKRSINLGGYYENLGETFGRKYDPVYKQSHGYYDKYGRNNEKYYEEYYRKHNDDDKEDLDDDICDKIYDDNYVDQYRKLCITTLGQLKEHRKRTCRKMAKRARKSSFELCRRVMKKKVDMKAKVSKEPYSWGTHFWSIFNLTGKLLKFKL
ncbi:uncharacterized protein LOC135690208 [Rhopilema esculentum]|uniref:uncharacterized protein LOC135690208 n=1 Tax=Rhopilema esculentum TaxID=499914 RepID=UPI0031D41C7F